MIDKKVLKLALEYLRDNQHYIADNERHVYVMEYNAFVERLEALAEQPAQQALTDTELINHGCRYQTELTQPAQQQEPVAWMCSDESLVNKGYSRFSRTCEGAWNIPVYTSPPSSKPLTDDEIAELMKQTWGCASIAPRHAPAFARSIEAKLKDKNGY